MTPRILLLAGTLVALVSGSVLAQTAAPAAPARAASPAPAAAPAARPAAARPAQAQPRPAAPRPLPPATPEQLEAAQLAHYGDYACEFDQSLKVSLNPETGGYVNVAFKGRTHVMKPVLSSTGALRLEDVTGRTLMIQIGSKSMLMDTKIGQRLVDECVHAEQVKVRQAAAVVAPS